MTVDIDDVRRVETNYIPEGKESRDEIAEHMQKELPEFSPKAIDVFSEKISEMRGGGIESAIKSVLNRSTKPMGRGRSPMIRDTNNRVLGKSDNVVTWVDRWGNLMGYNTNTGRRAKIGEVGKDES